ncbi:MAG: HD domain-containing phosphohydrolase [Phycisphaeraceae bacterium]
MRILIVDDDNITLDMLRHALKEAGHKVEAVTNARRALDMIRLDSHRLVISDWEMPDMDGIELCRAVRAEELPSYVYFILLTSHTRPEEVVEGLSAGADDFITKPFNSAELIVRVRAGERILALETRDLAIFALAKLAESRDPETGAHLERVRNYSRILAQHLANQPKYRDALDTEYVRLIYQTSPLHDIGKVGIPDAVLLKPGQLSDAEFEIMKIHTKLGAQTLDAALQSYPNARFLEMARDIAASHHERFDGSGYPEGLKGEHIPLCARIVALADVYDAVTSRRVYKGALPHDTTRTMIVEGSGSHFDPDVVSAFVRNEDKFIATQEQFAISRPTAA